MVEPFHNRFNNPSLKKAILGALVYLEDTQIRNRRSYFRFNVPWTDEKTVPFIPMAGHKVDDKVGGWLSDFHLLPKLFGHHGRTLVSIPDPNLFTTASILYSLFLIRDFGENGKSKTLQEVRQKALQNINSYKRDKAYCFWGASFDRPGVGPLNFRSFPIVTSEGKILDGILRTIFSLPGIHWAWKHCVHGLDLPPAEAFDRISNGFSKPWRTAKFMNIPSDADDTSLAVAMQWLYQKELQNFQVDIPALEFMSQFRDIHRTKQHALDAWKGKDSGAFLTWLRDENEPIFGNPKEGVVPLGVNNVDAVVNANAVFALALCGKKDLPGYHDAMNTLVRAIEEKTWLQHAGLYYPQYMMFPYTVSRAFRDGGATEPVLQDGLKKLLADILGEWENQGTFPLGADKCPDLPTALGVSTLLNLGRDLAREIKEETRYDQALRESVHLLLTLRKDYRVQNLSTFRSEEAKALQALQGTERPLGSVWRSGLFFSGDYWDLAQWRSAAYTTAMALEGIAKYMVGYDYGGVVTPLELNGS